jgi:hypothetical protein
MACCRFRRHTSGAHGAASLNSDGFFHWNWPSFHDELQAEGIGYGKNRDDG